MEHNDVRVIKTKEYIFSAFLSALRLYSFHDLTVKTIIEKARINRTTFYRYYTDKFDLLDQTIATVESDFSANMDDSFLELSYEQAIIYHPKIIKMLTYFEEKRYPLVTLWNAKLPEDLFLKMQNILIENMEHHISQQLLENERTMLYLQLFSSTTMITIRWWLESTHPISKEELVSTMASNIEKGFFYTMKRTLHN